MFDQNTTRLVASKEGGVSANYESGFTLIELLVVLIILPLILGAISAALLAAFRVQSNVSDRLSASGDTQVVSASYYKDIQNTAEIFAPASSATTTLPQCGTTAPILSLQWPEASGLSTVVSYSVSPNGHLRPGVNQYELVRSYCKDVGETTTPSSPTSSSFLAGNVPSDLIATINNPIYNHCASSDASCTSAAVAAQSKFICLSTTLSTLVPSCSGNTYEVDDVSMLVKQEASNPNNSNFSFTLDATPRTTNAVGGNGGGLTYSVAPLELLSNADGLVTCSSGADLNINGPVVFNAGTSGKPAISASAVYWYGTAPSTTFVNSGTTPAFPPLTQLNAPYVDSLQNLPVPSSSSMTTDPAPVSGVYQPGVYTKTLGNADLAPGIYYFTGPRAGISVGAQDALSGSGVLLYFTDSASISFGPNSTVALSPATSGPYAGITIWQDQSDTQDVGLSGSANESGLTGVVYIPGATLALNGGPTFYASNLIAQNISCKGGGRGTIDLGYTYVPTTFPTLSYTAKPPTTATVGNTAIVAAKSSNSTGNPVTYTIDVASTSNCSISNVNTITFSSPGNCIVDVNQLGSNTTAPYYGAYELQSTTNVNSG